MAAAGADGVRPVPLLWALAVLVAGCTPSLYRPLILEDGYASTRVNTDTFSVMFQGNKYTPRDTAETYALYRAAELTLESGFDYFVVIGGNSRALYGASVASFTSTAGGEGSEPIVVVLFKAFKGEKPGGAAYSAREVLRELEPSITRSPG
jgi:hypothetical protein